LIEVSNLTKRFGTQTAVDDLSFTVEPGRVTGFLGPNGAGKSTTMRLILGLDRPQGGTALIFEAHQQADQVLSPWQGFGVFCVWTAVLLAAAGFLLVRRDA